MKIQYEDDEMCYLIYDIYVTGYKVNDSFYKELNIWLGNIFIWNQKLLSL